MRRRDLRYVHRGHHEPAPHPEPRQEPPGEKRAVRRRHGHAPGAGDENRARYRDRRLSAKSVGSLACEWMYGIVRTCDRGGRYRPGSVTRDRETDHMAGETAT